MMRFGVLLTTAVISLIFFWHECGGDLGVFCYRIGSGAFSGLRSRALVPVPVQKTYSATRNNAECLTPSFTSSTPCSTPRDSER
jgi:hypothetical protein